MGCAGRQYANVIAGALTSNSKKRPGHSGAFDGSNDSKHGIHGTGQ